LYKVRAFKHFQQVFSLLYKEVYDIDVCKSLHDKRW